MLRSHILLECLFPHLWVSYLSSTQNPEMVILVHSTQRTYFSKTYRGICFHVVWHSKIIFEVLQSDFKILVVLDEGSKSKFRIWINSRNKLQSLHSPKSSGFGGNRYFGDLENGFAGFIRIWIETRLPSYRCLRICPFWFAVIWG